MNGKALVAVGLAVLMLPGSALAQSSASGSDGAATGTDTVTFWGHPFSLGLQNPMPANTQFPAGEENLGLGFGIECTSATPTRIPDPTGTFLTDDVEDCENEEGNKMALFSTAGPVDVENRAQWLQEGTYGLLHNERGQTKNVLLDTSQELTAQVYLTWDSHGWAVGVGNNYGTNCMGPHPPNVPCLYPYWGWDPGAYENVVVKATLYHADLGNRSTSSQAPPVMEALNSGDATQIATGQWGPDTVMNGLPGAPQATKFTIPMGNAQVSEIPRSDDFFLVYESRQESSGENACIDCPVRWYSGEFFPPKFTMPVKNAFTVERLIPNFANGQMAFLGIINTPWGSYDVDTESVDLEIDGPNGPVQADELTRFSDFSVAHGGHFEPVNVTWIWDYRSEQVPAGEYEVTVSAENFQNSASATCTATFTIDKTDEGQLAAGEAKPAICGTQSELADEKAREVQQDVNGTE